MRWTLRPCTGSFIAAVAVFTLRCTDLLACETTDISGNGNVKMIVPSGATCSVNVGAGLVRTGGGNASGNMRKVMLNKGVRIVERPSHGQAGVAGVSSIAYVAKANYHGPDRIRAAVDMEANDAAIVRNVTIEIEVR